jgi:hypothetical protein
VIKTVVKAARPFPNPHFSNLMLKGKSITANMIENNMGTNTAFE